MLRTPTGTIVNAFRANIEEEFDSGRLSIVRNSVMKNICYRYFITSKEQYMTFIDERENGTTDGPHKLYHVYVDDDVDTTTAEYRYMFSPLPQ